MYRKLTSEAARLEQEELDIRCLQLLRATIHNEERKLPEDWEENAADNKKYFLAHHYNTITSSQLSLAIPMGRHNEYRAHQAMLIVYIYFFRIIYLSCNW